MFYSISTGGFYDRSIHGNNIPYDAVEITSEEHAALLQGQSAGKMIKADGNGKPLLVNPPAPTTTQTIAKYESALDAHLDAVAQSHRYRDRITFAMRAGYPGPYQAEGAAFGSWMDTCNAQSYALLGRVEAGTEAMPTIEAFLASLPEFALP